MELIDNFRNCIKFPFSNRVAFLTFRIVDETLKRVYVKKLSDEFFPIDLKDVGLKLMPNQVLMRRASVIAYDSN